MAHAWMISVTFDLLPHLFAVSRLDDLNRFAEVCGRQGCRSNLGSHAMSAPGNDQMSELVLGPFSGAKQT